MRATLEQKEFVDSMVNWNDEEALSNNQSLDWLKDKMKMGE